MSGRHHRSRHHGSGRDSGSSETCRRASDWTGYALFLLIYGGGWFSYGYASEDRTRALAWALCGLAAVWAMTRWAADRFELRRGSAATWLLGLMGLTILWAGLQLVPLPAGLAASVSPFWGEALEAMESVGYTTPEKVPLAVAPEAASRAWNQMIASVLFFVAALAMASRRRGFLFLAGLIAASALVESLLGLWTYVLSDARRASGFIFNPNHHAAFIISGLPIAAWWLRSKAGNDNEFDYERDRGRDLLIFLTIVVLLAFLGWMLSLSRGSLIALVVVGGLDLLYRAVIMMRKPKLGTISNSKPTGLLGLDSWIVGWATAAGVLLLAASGVFGLIAERMDQTDSLGSRAAIWSAAGQGFLESPFVGLGAGGTDSAINRHLVTITSDVRQVWAHNDYVQVLTDYGGVWTLVALALVAMVAVRVRKEWSEDLKRLPTKVRQIKGAALGGILIVLVHSFFDFHLRIPLVGFQVLALGALVLTRPKGSSRIGPKRNAGER